jgi:LPXTG-site transpeptidase (sortase) family protein
LVARRGFEPLISALKGRRPRPLDERALFTDCSMGKAVRSSLEMYRDHSEGQARVKDEANPRWLVAGLVLLLSIAFGGLWLSSRDAGEAADREAPPAPAFSAELRYIGRDGVTGMPVRVDDRFIAERQRGIERYGQDRREPVPPPPKNGAEISALRVPSLEINHETGRYGLDEYGRLDVPQDRTTIGWHPAYSSLPGEDGATFLAAHYEYQGQPGVFYSLATLEPGSVVYIETEDGGTHAYRVTSTIDYDLAVIDMGALLRGREGVESVVLMTCSGPVVQGNYQWRTVVLAERVGL